ncbi:DUF432 domain-containing protein [Mangrovibacterium lignilyticum]|uniref:DUF432 domain-containing protein n=1 Tax=Mangrovibacterium lignilyticum TaxID=2668052 RepID=UPI0013D45DAC|nr:DUF432 domain-containing protein [Mangrovibacterium lignilyticum]
MQKQKTIWGKYEGKAAQIIRCEGGYCALQMEHLPGGWLIRQEKKAEIAAQLIVDQSTAVQSLSDAQIYQTGRSAVLHILPAMPPKPVVLRSNKKVSIRPHQTLRIYLAVPLYIQLYYKQVENDNLLCDYETERLSDTWFGEPDSGTPAFTVGSRFGLQPEELAVQQHEIIVPVNIHNASTQLLDLQRLLIHVELMNLYQLGDKLVADMGTIEFKGQEQVGHVNFSTDKALHGTNPTLIGKARQTANRNILGHSFHFIKQMTQL